MSLPGVYHNDEADFPMTVKESLTVLPFKAGGTTTLGTTDVKEDLVLVSALRRFENDVIAAGTHTGSNNASTLTDSAADFLNWGVEVGDTIANTTDGSSGTITAVTATTISVALSGGTDDDFDTSDAYTITKALSHQGSRAQMIRKVRIITDLECYIKFDGDASASDHDVHLEAGEAFNDENIRIVSRISVINVVTSETPEFRWLVWGV